MAQTGFTPIALYNTSTATAVPVNTNLVNGELAINITDEKLYFKNAAGVVKLLASNAASATTFSAGTTGLTPSTATAGAVTLAGTLAVANGGTGVTTSTGTTNVVLSNSPTLVTPALCTPSALVGTNITGTATAFTASNVTTNANLTGEVTSVGNAATLTNASVISKVLTGYVSGAGTVAATDSILQAIQKLNGNAGSVNLTGAITSVGAATSLGSFTSAQLATALTDETGTGANVFATSPTFAGSPAAPTQSFGDNSTLLSTTAFVQAAMAALHPIGSIYLNATNSTNPGTLLGFGTWVAFGAGRVPVGFNAANPLFDTAEKTGGSADAVLPTHTHTATVTDPSHTHTQTSAIIATLSNVGTLIGSNGFIGGYTNGSNGATSAFTNTATTGITVSNSTAGTSATNANYQPYITVYMWKRSA